jgi:3-phytase
MNRFLLASSAMSLALISGCASAPPVLENQALVMSAIETAPAGSQGDAADDPALWRHPSDASKSLIIGTNKQTGLVVYTLDGKLAQSLPIGRLNNVDLRQSTDRPYDVAVASNDEANAISVFFIDRVTSEVTHHGDLPVTTIEPYGICQGRENGVNYAGVTYKDGTVEIWSLTTEENTFGGQLVKSMKLATQLEGCVFDEAQGLLFVGEEGRGLWKFSYRDEAPEPELIDEIGGEAGLVADVEGVSLWRGKDGAGWIVVSAQTDDRFVVYDRKAPHSPMGSFSVGENPSLEIDNVTHTDGLDVFSGTLPGYPRGVFIAQDDGNPKKGQDQNFKLVSWADIEAALGLPVLEAE